MNIEIPLSTLLSQVLIAFTIEFDNEWEWRFTSENKLSTVRISSMVMWANFLRFVNTGGITVREVSEKVGYPYGKSHPSLHGVIRWGYVTDNLQGPSEQKKPKLDSLIFLTSEGIRATIIWQSVLNLINQHWENRFGGENIIKLKKVLINILNKSEYKLPHYLHVVYSQDGMRAMVPDSPESDSPEKLSLPFLLSQVLHTFTLDFEKNSELSLPLMANVIRPLNDKGVPLKELPTISGISKEAIAMAIRFLQKEGYIEIDNTVPRNKLVRLTDNGCNIQNEYLTLLENIEKLWEDKFGLETVNSLRSSLKSMLIPLDKFSAPLINFQKNHPNIWRSKLPFPKILAHYPMVLHRGGWPDGS